MNRKLESVRPAEHLDKSIQKDALARVGTDVEVRVDCPRRYEAIDAMNQKCFSSANKQPTNYIEYRSTLCM